MVSRVRTESGQASHPGPRRLPAWALALGLVLPLSAFALPALPLASPSEASPPATWDRPHPSVADPSAMPEGRIPPYKASDPPTSGPAPTSVSPADRPVPAASGKDQPPAPVKSAPATKPPPPVPAEPTGGPERGPSAVLPPPAQRAALGKPLAVAPAGGADYYAYTLFRPDPQSRLRACAPIPDGATPAAGDYMLQVVIVPSAAALRQAPFAALAERPWAVVRAGLGYQADTGGLISIRERLPMVTPLEASAPADPAALRLGDNLWGYRPSGQGRTGTPGWGEQGLPWLAPLIGAAQAPAQTPTVQAQEVAVLRSLCGREATVGGAGDGFRLYRIQRLLGTPPPSDETAVPLPLRVFVAPEDVATDRAGLIAAVRADGDRRRGFARAGYLNGMPSPAHLDLFASFQADMERFATAAPPKPVAAAPEPGWPVAGKAPAPVAAEITVAPAGTADSSPFPPERGSGLDASAAPVGPVIAWLVGLTTIGGLIAAALFWLRKRQRPAARAVRVCRAGPAPSPEVNRWPRWLNSAGARLVNLRPGAAPWPEAADLDARIAAAVERLSADLLQRLEGQSAGFNADREAQRAWQVRVNAYLKDLAQHVQAQKATLAAQTSSAPTLSATDRAALAATTERLERIAERMRATPSPADGLRVPTCDDFDVAQSARQLGRQGPADSERD